ncbi:MAG: endonuclease [Xanthomonadales bacterium]|nr:endonuclease [Xanthomonadales bacterium]
MKKIFCMALCMGMALSVRAGLEDLVISEIRVTPTEGEFFEIHNKGATEIDLSNVYVTDATGDGNFYYNITTGSNYGGGSSADFHAKFPNGAIIGAGEYQSIAINGSNFFGEYGINPTYELNESDSTPNMLEAVAGSINNQGGLSNAGEFLVLYFWDGSSDLVQDLDYVVWGDQAEAVDKSGVTIGGSTYLNETPIISQDVIASGVHTFIQSWQRIDLNEGTEILNGGNGISGHDETSENLSSTFAEGTPNPAGGITPVVAQFVINEIDAVSNSNDFIELYGNANTSTDGYTLVLYDGFTDVSTNVISLNGMNTDTNGYLVINTTLEGGADAVALYVSDVTNFNVGDAITSTDIMDAIVYDSGQADDAELLALINPGQPQVNEDANGDAMNESLIRCTNGSGGQLNTNSFKAFTPSPGAENADCVTFGDYYATADDTNATTLRNTLHDIIDDHCTFNYSGPSTCGSNTEDTWSLLSKADEDPDVPGQVWMVYKNNNFTFQGGGQQAYNREHTWPQSYGFSSGALGDNNAARTDVHHLMMSEVGYNGDRGNLYFDNCDAQCNERSTDTHENPNTPQNDTIGGGSGVYPGNSNWFDGNSFEVWNFRKGDIARAMFYLDVRYSGDVAGEVDLQLTDNASLIQTGAPYMGLLSTLLEWHVSDPVDDIERNRNDFIFTKQLNRNPFIDHPEWVECIFVTGGTCGTVDNDLIFENGFE